MLGFIPPPSDKKKKKDRDELGEEMDQEVKYPFTQIVIITFVHNSSKCYIHNSSKCLHSINLFISRNMI